jgi:hypothetical protein
MACDPPCLIRSVPGIVAQLPPIIGAVFSSASLMRRSNILEDKTGWKKFARDLPGASGERRAHKRQAPFVYAIDRDTVVRFMQRRGRIDWAFVYSAGMLIDARPRKR